MKIVDLDGDGKIDYLEFIQAAIDHRSLLNKENIQTMFDLFDTNHDGTISMEELKSTFQGTGKDDQLDFLEEIMEEVDKNRDNMISFEEFNEGVTKMLNNTIKKIKWSKIQF